jgi:hypothetical protein
MIHRQQKHFLHTALGGAGAQCFVCGDDQRAAHWRRRQHEHVPPPQGGRLAPLTFACDGPETGPGPLHVRSRKLRYVQQGADGSGAGAAAAATDVHNDGAAAGSLHVGVPTANDVAGGSGADAPEGGDAGGAGSRHMPPATAAAFRGHGAGTSGSGHASDGDSDAGGGLGGARKRQRRNGDVASAGSVDSSTDDVLLTGSAGLTGRG